MSSGIINQTLGEFSIYFDSSNFTNINDFVQFLQKNMLLKFTFDNGNILILDPEIFLDTSNNAVYVINDFNDTYITSYEILICSQKSSTLYNVEIGVSNTNFDEQILFQGKTNFISSGVNCRIPKSKCFKIYFKN